MGGLARIASAVADFRTGDGQVLIVSAGDMLFPKSDPKPYQMPQFRYIATWLMEKFPGDLMFLGLRDRNMLENHDPSRFSYTIIDAAAEEPVPVKKYRWGAIDIGFVGLSIENPAQLADGTFRDQWCQAVKSRINAFRAEHEVWAMIGLSSMGSGADTLVAPELPELDIILGSQPGKLDIRTEKLAKTLLAHVIDNGKYIAKLELDFPGALPEKLDMTKLENAQDMRILEMDIANLNEKIAVQKKLETPSAQNLIKLLESRKTRQEAELASLVSKGNGYYFYHWGIPLDSSFEKDPETEKAIVALRADLMKINMAAPDTLIKPEAEIQYAGQKRCAECHARQVVFVSDQHHAKAFDSLVRTGTDGDITCIGCHAAGFGEEGGIFHIKQLEPYKHVQCESCHGPGKQHAGEPSAHKFRKVNADVCIRCHDKENSDEVITSELIEVFHCPAQ